MIIPRCDCLCPNLSVHVILPVAASKVCPVELATACQRVAQGGGCPADGHLVHSAFQSQAVFGFAGQKSNAVKVTAVAGTDGDWNVVGSRLAQICIGASSDGKDNLKGIVLGWLEKNYQHAPSAATVWRQGHITVHGLMNKLPQTRQQIQLINGELEKIVMSGSKSNYLAEEDLIELLDGSCAFGKGTAQSETCMSPHVCMWVGCVQATYLKVMAAASNGRARLAVLTFDGESVRERPFEESFFPRKDSDCLMTFVLGAIYKLQHRPDAAGDNAAGAKARPKRKMMRKAKAKARPPALPSTHPKITEVVWTAGAGSVLAGVCEGSGKACNKSGQASGVSCVRKHTGKFYGALALSNLAIRNGLLAYALSDVLPEDWPNAFIFDHKIRLLDAIAAMPRMELYSINQLHLERLLVEETKKNARPIMIQQKEELDEEPVDLLGEDKGVLRLLEGMVAWENGTGAVGEPWDVPCLRVWFWVMIFLQPRVPTQSWVCQNPSYPGVGPTHLIS